MKYNPNDDDLWTIAQNRFDRANLHHQETVFTIGNGYLCTRGAFEEGYPGDHGATFIHGVFDAARNVNTEIVNETDWLPLGVYLDGERFALNRGTVQAYRRTLDLRNGLLTRTVRWQSPTGRTATLTFERFASLADPHLVMLRCAVLPEFAGTVEFRAALNGHTDNLGVVHSYWLDQGQVDGVVFMHNQTRGSQIDTAYAMRVATTTGNELARAVWEVENKPAIMVRAEAQPGKAVVLAKEVVVFTSRDVPPPELLTTTLEHIATPRDWDAALAENSAAWGHDWERADIIVEGDDAAQRAIRFNLFELLIAAPRHDDRVSIGAKTLSGFGYRGHVFWDTEIFMLPFFTYCAPEIARNLLEYRYSRLEAAHDKARQNGVEGAMFPWESADTGEEVTPTWIPDPADRRRLVRIWTGDIELHISADVAYAAFQYWRVTGDDEWFTVKGAELILDTAKFWASRAQWNAEKARYEYNDVIGPDEYHDHVDNNAFTNRMAQWNLQTALDVLAWLRAEAPAQADALATRLDLSPERLAHWHDVIDKTCFPLHASGIIEQFEGYCDLMPVYMAALEPRDVSTQTLFGIEGSNQRQAIKQPDVLMLLYLLRDRFDDAIVRVNYEFYNPRTDSTYGSSLGPAIQSVIASDAGKPEDAYRLFKLACEADLYDVRHNASDGIHGASAGGTWQAVVFGFAGLRLSETGWTLQPRLPQGWKRLAFNFMHRGKMQNVDIVA